MFAKKSNLESLEKRVKWLEHVVAKPTQKLDDSYTACEVCRCILRKLDAAKGEGVIRQKTSKVTAYNRNEGRMQSADVVEDFIYYPYYCKAHTPKPKNTKGQLCQDK